MMVKAFIDRYYSDLITDIRDAKNEKVMNLIIRKFKLALDSFSTALENISIFKEKNGFLSRENKLYFNQKLNALEDEAKKESQSLGTNYDNMDGNEFEQFCAKLLVKNGYKNVQVTSGSGDHGVDILAETPNGSTYAIQCSRSGLSITVEEPMVDAVDKIAELVALNNI